MSSVDVGGEARRGFTTLQLLELLSIATANQIHRSGKAVDEKTGEVISISGSYLVPDQLRAELGIYLPPTTHINVINALTKVEKHFNKGNADNAYRAITATGQAIEGKRMQILQLLFGPNGRAQFLSPDLQNWQPPNQSGVTAGKGASGSQLKKALVTSWSWNKVKGADGKTSKKQPNPNLNSLYQAVIAVATLTLANPAQEPADPARAAGGGVGQKRDGSAADLAKETQGTTGFLPKYVAELLKDRVQKGQLAPHVQAYFGIQPSTGAWVTQAKNMIDQKLGQPTVPNGQGGVSVNPQYAVNVFAAFTKVVTDAQNRTQVAGKNLVWTELTASLIKKLLAGQNVALGRDSVKGKMWAYDANQTSMPQGSQPSTVQQFTRMVYDTMFDLYVASGGQFRQNVAAAKKSSTARPSAARGILGVTDKAASGLVWEKPGQVSRFIRKAAQGQYSLAALKQAAGSLGVQYPQDVVLHQTLINLLVEAVVKNYASQVESPNGNAEAIQAVAAALKINGGFSKLKKAPQQTVQAARTAIFRHLDAAAGILTFNCVQEGGSARELKRIVKAHQVKVPKGTTDKQLCALLTSQNIAIAAPSTQISSSRRNESEAAAAPTSQRRKGGKKGKRIAASNLANLVAAPAGGFGPASARFGGVQNLFGGQQQPAALLPRPNSGGLLGQNTALPRPASLGLGLGTLQNTLAPTQQTAQFGNLQPGGLNTGFGTLGNLGGNTTTVNPNLLENF